MAHPDRMRPHLFDMQRRVVAIKTTEAWQNVPHVGFVYEPDVTDFLALYRDHREVDGVRITLNTLLLKVIAEGLRAAPKLNAYVRYDGNKAEGDLSVQDAVNIALPWMTKDGKMITPTVFGCERLSVPQLQRAVNDLRTRVDATHVEELLMESAKTETARHLRRLDLRYLRKAIAGIVTLHPKTTLKGQQRRDYYATDPKGRLSPHDLLGATVSVSNIGSMLPGIRGHFTMLQIIEPQVFVVGLNPPREEQHDGRTRTILPITLVFDHRPLDFSDLLPFISRCDDLFRDVGEVRGWLTATAG